MSNFSEKEDRLIGVVYGMVLFAVIMALGMSVATCKDPLYGRHPNSLLNDPKYTIDTIMTISNHDTTVEYQFIKLEE